MNKTKISELISTPRFLPLFLTQLMGAFNDNVYKNALVVLFTYKLITVMGLDISSIVAACTGLFILPFFLFSATGGQLADKYEKDRLIRYTKILEIGIMLLGAIGLVTGTWWLLLGVLFLMGSQSAIFGPVKYAILPVHLERGELLLGNALIEGSTYVAVLIGTVVGTTMIMFPGGMWIISGIVLVVSILGYLSSLKIPVTERAAPEIKVSWNIMKETVNVLNHAIQDRRVFLTIIGISWFWFLGATMVTIIPPYVSEYLRGSEGFIGMLISLFAVGIGFGAILCAKTLQGELSARYVPYAGLAMSASLLLFCKVNEPIPAIDNLFDFFLTFRGLLISGSLFSLALFGGMFSVPLYTMLQAWSQKGHCARNIGANNVINALFMAGSSILALVVYQFGGDIFTILKISLFLNILFSLMMISIIPESVTHTLFKYGVKFLYNLEVKGKENLDLIKSDEKLLIISNHASLMDPAIITPILPFKSYYAIDPIMRAKWWVRLFLWMCETFPVDPTSPYAVKKLAQLVDEGKRVVIFPEGRITTTGTLMKLYDGPALIAEKTGARILPIHISGAQRTPFSYMKGKLRRSLFPKITVTIGKPEKLQLPSNIKGKEARRAMTDCLYRMMSKNVVESKEKKTTLFEALISSAYSYKFSKKILFDARGNGISYGKLIGKSLMFGRMFAKKIKASEAFGLLMAGPASVQAFFAFQTINRPLTIFNTNCNEKLILEECVRSGIKKVLAIKEQITEEKLKYLENNGIKIIYFDQINESILDKMSYWIGKYFPSYVYWMNMKGSDLEEVRKNICVKLFCDDKLMTYTHEDLLSNVWGLSSVVDYLESDRALNVLGLGDPFSLVSGILSPLFNGVKLIIYPNEQHYGIIPELIYRENITLFFATHSLLEEYAERAELFDFYNLKYIITTRGPLPRKTMELFALKFGARILESHGEDLPCPIFCINTPLYHKLGSIGKFLPNIDYTINDDKSIALLINDRWEKLPNNIKIDDDGYLFLNTIS